MCCVQINLELSNKKTRKRKITIKNDINQSIWMKIENIFENILLRMAMLSWNRVLIKSYSLFFFSVSDCLYLKWYTHFKRWGPFVLNGISVNAVQTSMEFILIIIMRWILHQHHGLRQRLTERMDRWVAGGERMIWGTTHLHLQRTFHSSHSTLNYIR